MHIGDAGACGRLLVDRHVPHVDGSGGVDSQVDQRQEEWIRGRLRPARSCGRTDGREGTPEAREKRGRTVDVLGRHHAQPPVGGHEGVERLDDAGELLREVRAGHGLRLVRPTDCLGVGHAQSLHNVAELAAQMALVAAERERDAMGLLDPPPRLPHHRTRVEQDAIEV
ncbi:hypothetical protein SHKM778_18940 [Streptomyces sp. KM77-8]|uniref:Uncharacterized protein n=1 Tax=Streptomyces haneummycinicus TaxID=3074435 RepID=A0AAT9HDQ8_9ACTN